MTSTPMTADTQSQIDAIFNQVVQYNQQHDTVFVNIVVTQFKIKPLKPQWH